MFDIVGLRARALAITIALACSASVAQAQDAVLESDTRDGYAGPVAIQGDAAFVGVPGRARGAAGEVLVFTRMDGTWTLAQRITSPAGTSSVGNFGATLAVQGDALVVGAPALRAGAIERGEAYLFERSGGTWTLTADRVARPGDLVRYGSSVAISERWIVIGAPGLDSLTVVGTVVVFDRTGVGATVLLEADAAGTLLGTVVAAAGDAILASEPDTGSVVAYRHETAWSRTVALTQPGADGVATRFGASLAIAAVGGDVRALVGAPLGVGAAGTAGEVFAFDRIGGVWPAVGGQPVEIPGRMQSDGTGQSLAVAADGSIAVVGAPLVDSDGMANAGRVYVLSRAATTWSVLGTLEVAGAPPEEQLGTFVAIEGDTVLAGAPNALDAAGYVAVFGVPDPLGASCTTTSTCGSGRCVDDVCCESDCAGECTRCDASGACVADAEAAACTSACGVSGAAGVCRDGTCEPGDGACPDADVPASVDASTTMVADAGPRVRVSGCRCRVGDRADERAGWVALFVLGAVIARRVRTSRGT